MNKKYIPKEISWLSFNERVLQEAGDISVPVMERLKFLGIYSSNLGEFFKGQVATLRRLSHVKKKARRIIGENPEDVLNRIQEIVIKQGKRFDDTYLEILKELALQQIYIIDEKELTSEQGEYVLNYFQKSVYHKLMPMIIGEKSLIPYMNDESIYFAINIVLKNNKINYALMELPTRILSRFILLPKKDNKQFVILLDDVIRKGLKSIFYFLECKSIEAYTIKVTRDAELDIIDDISESFIRIISKGLQKRKEGNPVRFVYDATMPKVLLNILIKNFNIAKDDVILPGGRYHNFKDFIKFPQIGPKQLYYPAFNPVIHPEIVSDKSILSAILKKDILLYYPYHPFDSFINFLREASIDPKVTSIYITLYRLAADSSVVNALINAIRNGKQVIAVVELQARFDEEANIYWSNKLKEEGAKIIYGVPNLKVHSKLCLVLREDRNKNTAYACIGTGNFNEETTKTFCDFNLFTSNLKITKDVQNIFEFFKSNYNVCKPKFLIASPFQMRKQFEKMIKNEIANAQKGHPAYIYFKVNNLNDSQMINLLNKAAKAGVKITLNVRGILSMVVGKSATPQIEAFGIIDRFLEHARVYVFCNGGDMKFFISSADLMSRNIDRRVEITCPILDKSIQKQIQDILNFQMMDNIKARVYDEKQTNQYRKNDTKIKIQSQKAIYEYLKNCSHQL